MFMVHFAVAGWHFVEFAAATRGVGSVMTRFRRHKRVQNSMTPTDLLREVSYPIRRPMLLLAILFSWIMFTFAAYFGLFGMLVFLATLFPFLAYLMHVLEERSRGHDAPAFDAELMAFFGRPISLFPLVIAAAAIWSTIAAGRAGWSIGPLVTIVTIVLAPASLGVLAVTQTPLQAMNPFALARFVKRTGTEYLVLVMFVLALSLVLELGRRSGASYEILGLGLIYLLFVLYSMTGAICASHKLDAEVDVPAPIPASVEQTRQRTDKHREAISTHAYGFASRGNRASALAHIQADIDQDRDPDGAYEWYFNRMLRWEETDHALAFGQQYLHRLLEQQNYPRAVKLVGQCLHFNERFRPDTADRDEVQSLLREFRRDDLLRQLS